MAEMEAKGSTFHVGPQDLDPMGRWQTGAVHPPSLRWTGMPRCSFSPFPDQYLAIPLMPKPCYGPKTLIGLSQVGSVGSSDILVVCRNVEFLCAFRSSMGT